MSTTSIAALTVSVDTFAREWSAASIGGFPAETVSADAAGLGDTALLRVAASVDTVQRAIDAFRVTIAGEIAHRSGRSLGSDGMARKAGHAKPAFMVAELWKISVGEAIRLCEVGLATRARTAIDGTPLPSRYAAVASAMSSGELGLDSAAVIISALESASSRCSAADRGMAEAALVSRANDFTVADLKQLARQVRDRLDADGAEPRDELHHTRRAVRFITLSDGMTRMQWDMSPVTAGLVKAAVDAYVARELRRARDERRANGGGTMSGGTVSGGTMSGGTTIRTDGTDVGGDSNAPGIDAPGIDAPDTGAPDDYCDEPRIGADARHLDQLRSDAAEEVFHHVGSCAGHGGDIPAITMVIRMTLEDLNSGLGIATIDGVDESISAGTARRMAGDAGLIPAVLGGPSEVLDFGKTRRLFSTAQKLAFGERDGGCAFGGCTAPPSYTEAHHLIWWSTVEKTDLDNGILLCGFHHHRIHDGGWDITFQNGVPYFIPPPWVDPGRTPRRGGKVVLDEAA